MQQQDQKRVKQQEDHCPGYMILVMRNWKLNISLDKILHLKGADDSSRNSPHKLSTGATT
jgi:hypothetical protein